MYSSCRSNRHSPSLQACAMVWATAALVKAYTNAVSRQPVLQMHKEKMIITMCNNSLNYIYKYIPDWIILPNTFLPFFQSLTGQFHRWSFSWFWHSLMARRIAVVIANNRPGFSLIRRRCFFLKGKFMLVFTNVAEGGRMALACRPSKCVTWSKVSGCEGLCAMSLWGRFEFD